MAKILIVDDDADMRRVLRGFFERSGHKVIEADSPALALGMLEGPEQPDAIVSDVLMPETNGLEFYQQLLVRAPQFRNRVVFLTGASHVPTVHDPIEALGVPLLAKLDDLRLVVDAVRIALLRPLK